jgi:hypothetical protein
MMHEFTHLDPSLTLRVTMRGALGKIAATRFHQVIYETMHRFHE